MPIYVAEITGRAIAAFHAETYVEAMDKAGDEWFRADLAEMKFEGRPIWDGTSEILVREALGDERARWEDSKARGVLEAEVDGSEESDWLTYLIFECDQSTTTT